ncbi:MAG: DUF1254 domain-containing protein [Alphaproteobacteria bacterium]
MMNKSIDEQVTSGAAWAQFCDDLKAVGDLLLQPENPQDAFTQAEGMRYLSRLTRMGLENFLEYRDPLFPVFRRSCHETIKLGGDNPDNHYANAQIDGSFDYKITGSRGSVHYLGIGTQSGNYGKDGTLQTIGFIDADKDIAINDDGSFEIIVSQTEQPGNWLKMTDGTGMVLVRQTFHDRETETPAVLTIERLNAEGEAPAPLSSQRIAHGLMAASRYVAGSVKLFLEWSHEFRTYDLNTFKMLDHKRAQRVGGDPNIRYFYGWYDFADDEALVITTPLPECDYWNIQLCNFWMESFDYRYHRVHLNHHLAQNDGKTAEVVVAHRQLDHPNAIETAGHKEGVLMWRWIGASDHPVPQVRKVKISEIAG